MRNKNKRFLKGVAGAGDDRLYGCGDAPPPETKVSGKAKRTPASSAMLARMEQELQQCREDLQTTREGGKTQLIVLAIEDIMGGPRTQRSDETKEVTP